MADTDIDKLENIIGKQAHEIDILKMQVDQLRKRPQVFVTNESESVTEELVSGKIRYITIGRVVRIQFRFDDGRRIDAQVLVTNHEFEVEALYV